MAELPKLVGLRPEYMRRFPHAFSWSQRIGIARALALSLGHDESCHRAHEIRLRRAVKKQAQG